MLDRVTLVGKESGQTMWAKITWLRLCGVTVLGWKRRRGAEKDQVWGWMCARVTPYTPSKNKRKWMRILLIFLTMAGSQGWQARGCLFPLSACSASNEQQSLPRHGLEWKVKLIVLLSYSQSFCITCCPAPELSSGCIC